MLAGERPLYRIRVTYVLHQPRFFDNPTLIVK